MPPELPRTGDGIALIEGTGDEWPGDASQSPRGVGSQDTATQARRRP